MAETGDVLIDAIDRRKRIAQHGLIAAGIVMLLLARQLVEPSLAAALAAIAAGVILFAAAAATSQRWVVRYQGHEIAVENNPLRGERLLIGGAVAAKGRLGMVSTMEAAITTPFGREEIVVRTEARLTSFRCVIRVRRSAAASPSDAELLAEVRRRGLA